MLLRTPLHAANSQLDEKTGNIRQQSNDVPIITDKAYMNIKIANYTEESRGKNRGAEGSGTLVIGLYGKAAPESVKLFLETIQSNGTGEIPTYNNAIFSRVTPEGLLEMEKLPRLNAVNIAGSDRYEYLGNVMDYKPILENNKISHNRTGLLTRRQLASGPEFSITFKPATELDSFHIVFGEVLEGFEVLDAISSIPIYSYSTSTGYASKKAGVEKGIADKWFESQKTFYVGVGKAFGDMRAIDRRGKLLKRVTVKGSGMLK